MSAQITTITQDLVWAPGDVERLWFFPDGSEHLRYSPHFHIITKSGFRQNFPLTHMFVVVYAKTESQSLLDAIKMMIIARTHKPKS
jgi:hypothetical protein